MNEVPSTENAPEFTGRPAAFYLGSGLLLAFFLVLVFAWQDNGQRKVLETTAEFAAVGDAHYFPMPPIPAAPVEPFPAVATFHGQPLYLADYRKHTFQPDDMTRVGVTDEGAYIIYRAPKRDKDADERKRGEMYYLKLSPLEYLKTRALKTGQAEKE
jgi:hypothetical protein